MKRVRINEASKVDSDGRRVAPGDIVLFHLDPQKPWKRPSEGTVVRWISDGIAEVRYSGPSIEDHGVYDLTSEEIELYRVGANSRRAGRSGVL